MAHDADGGTELRVSHKYPFGSWLSCHPYRYPAWFGKQHGYVLTAEHVNNKEALCIAFIKKALIQVIPDMHLRCLQSG